MDILAAIKREERKFVNDQLSTVKVGSGEGTPEAMATAHMPMEGCGGRHVLECMTEGQETWRAL
jgi:hypothetical protein